MNKEKGNLKQRKKGDEEKYQTVSDNDRITGLMDATKKGEECKNTST